MKCTKSTRPITLTNEYGEIEGFILTTYILRIFALCLGLFFCVSIASHAMSGAPSDEIKWQYSQKAKIIKHLVEIVEWPNFEAKGMRICTIGSFPYDKELQNLDGTTVNKHKIEIVKISDALKTDQNCQIIYIGKSELKNASKIIEAYTKKPVLLISDVGEFAEQGGNMNFVMLSANAVGLTVNLDRMEQSNLKIDMKEFQQFTIFPEEQEINKLLK